mmetsp:Transcript_26421/g.66488  ORF Transcript_26421/g.66488 Transcript_26421/m.66488 type:complete len:116 (-) Transcript_26421:4-351(-)
MMRDEEVEEKMPSRRNKFEGAYDDLGMKTCDVGPLTPLWCCCIAVCVLRLRSIMVMLLRVLRRPADSKFAAIFMPCIVPAIASQAPRGAGGPSETAERQDLEQNPAFGGASLHSG